MKNKTLYREIDGDLIESFKDGKFDVIAHGCNCYTTMGAGIALTIGNEFPEAKRADEKLPIANGPKRLGKLSYAKIDIEGKDTKSLLFNLYSQHMPGPDFKLKALISSLRWMTKVIEQEYQYKNSKGVSVFKPNKIKIGLPLIGCGIAGGDWEEVREYIKEELSEFDVTIVHFSKRVIGVNYWPEPKKKNK